MRLLAQTLWLAGPVIGAGVVHIVVIRRGWLNRFARAPLDCGLTLRGRRLLGDNKTARGAATMIVATSGTRTMSQPATQASSAPMTAPATSVVALGTAGKPICALRTTPQTSAAASTRAAGTRQRPCAASARAVAPQAKAGRR